MGSVSSLKRIALAALVVCGTLMSSCAPKARTLPISSEEIKPLITAAKEFPREFFGFSPLPTSPQATVSVSEGDRSKGYDWLLKFHGSSLKTVAISRDPESKIYRWVHEGEMFYGPNWQQSEKGPVRENVYLVYETKPISAPSLNKLHISYEGPSSHLAGRTDLTLEEVGVLLRAWRKISTESVKPKDARNEVTSILERN